MGMKHIHIIACGGTIAGIGERAESLTQYQAGKLAWQEMVQAVPVIRKTAVLTGEQFCNLDSADMTEALWIKLAGRIRTVLQKDSCDGVVVTHGTDTLEETAYFLNLTVHTDKPIILTGAMRPATALSADGPLNILAAVQTAAVPEAGKYGVLVVMNNRICAARFVEKTDTAQVDSFQCRQQGYVGVVQENRPYFYQRPLRLHTYESQLILPITDELPYVPIVYCHVGMDPNLFSVLAAAGAPAMVLVGLGHGRMPQGVYTKIEALQKQGVLFVRTSRVSGGTVTFLQEYAGCLWGDSLTPQKAKILLQLALLQGADSTRIQHLLQTH